MALGVSPKPPVPTGRRDTPLFAPLLNGLIEGMRAYMEVDDSIASGRAKSPYVPRAKLTLGGHGPHQEPQAPAQ